MAGVQRIVLVSLAATATDLKLIRDDLGPDPVVLSAPTSEAKRVVSALGVEPQVEVLLAPVQYPGVERGHLLDAMVRGRALSDRFRDVVVVTDPATSTLLLRVLAPDQLPTAGAATVVGLPRGDRPVAIRRTIVAGILLAVSAGMAQTWLPILIQPAVVAGVGLALLLVERWRSLGRELLIASGVAAAAIFLGVASSARFPGGW